MRSTYIVLKIICCLIMSYSACAKDDQNTSFDQAVQTLIKEKPQTVVQSQNGKQKPVVWYTYEELRKCIDALAALYLLWRVGSIYYYTYHMPSLLTTEHTQESVILKGFGYLKKTLLPFLVDIPVIPQSLQALITYFGFARAVTLVAMEVIIYKTITKFIVYCCYADLFDIAEQGVIRVKRLVSALFLL